MSPNDPQPLPQAGVAKKTWQLVVDDMWERDEMGARKYGVRHQHDNGRDHLVDGYQEVLDLACYMRAEIERRRTERARAAAMIRVWSAKNAGPDSTKLSLEILARDVEGAV